MAAENSKDHRRGVGTLQMTAGALMLSFSAVFVKWAHVGPTTAGFYRMFFGALLLLGAVLVRKERLFQGTHHLKTVLFCGLLFALDITLWHRSTHFIGPGLATLMLAWISSILQQPDPGTDVPSVESAPSVDSPFTPEANALIDPLTLTVTVSRPSTEARFYRLSACRAFQITRVELRTDALKLHYQ